MHIRKYSILGLLLIFLSTAWGQQKAMTPAAIAVLKKKVTASMQRLQSLESDFTQTKRLDYLDHDITSSGKLYFKAPAKIRWEYHDPTPYVVIFDQQTMFVKSGDQNPKKTSMTSNKLLRGLNDVLMSALEAGNIFDENRFTISYQHNGSNYHATLIPKGKNLRRYIKQINLMVDGSSYLIKRVKITDPAQDYTRIAFHNQRENTPLDTNKFTISQ